MSEFPLRPETGYAALIEAAQAGDAVARDAAIRWVYPKVQAMVHKRLRSNILLKNAWLQPMFSTGDVVQDVFVGVLSTVPKLEGKDEDAVVGYLATAVHNRLMDMMRFYGAGRRDARRNSDLTDLDATVASASSPRREVEVKEMIAIYLEVLESFDPQQRAILRGRLEQGQPFDRIAARVGVSTGDAARKQFNELYAKLLMRLSGRGVRAHSRDTRHV